MRAWRPPGRLWAPCGPKVAARSPERLLGGHWRLRGPSWGPLGASWASSGPPGGLPEDPGSLREAIFGAFFGGRRRDPEISCFLMIVCLFSILFSKSFLTIGCRPCGKAGASVHLEKTRFRSERVSNLASRPFARTAKQRRNKAKKDEGKHTKTL